MSDDTPAVNPEFPLDLSPIEPEPYAGKFVRRWFDSLSDADWCSLLRFYRVLRIAYWDKDYGEMGWYGKSRAEARNYLMPIAQELDWYAYLGSK